MKFIIVFFLVIFYLNNNSISYAQENIYNLDKQNDNLEISNIAISSKLLNNIEDFTDIFEINLNESWSFSSLVEKENNNVYIAIKYVPSQILKNLLLNESNTIVRNNEKHIFFNKQSITKIDKDNMLLSVNLDENFFNSNYLSIRNNNDKLQSNPINALYANYSLYSDKNFSSINGNFNFVFASKKNWLFKNDFQYSNGKINRQNSVLQKTFDNYSGISFGDVNSHSLNNFGGLNVFGLKYSTASFNSSYGILDILPEISLNGFAITPSKMDLYFNSQKIDQKQINTGKYNINIPYQNQGLGIFNAYVYDINGELNIISIPFYSTNNIIKKGKNEYSITSGLIKTIDKNKVSYDKPYISAIYKGGILDNLTQDVFLQYSSYYSSFSTISNFVIHKNIGLIKAGISHNSLKQNLIDLTYERVTDNFSFGITATKSNSNKGFCLGYNQNCIVEEKSMFLGTQLPKNFGSINLNHIQKTTDLGYNKSTSIQYNKSFNKKGSLFISYSKNNFQNYQIDKDKLNNNVLYVGYSFNFGKISSNVNVNKNTKDKTYYQQQIYIPEDKEKPYLGWGSVSLNESKSYQSANAYYGANLDNFSYQVNLFQDKKNSSISTGISGAVVYIPEEKYFKTSKQIQGGLVFVKIQDLTSAVNIYHENRLSGKSDNKGRYLVTEAISMNNENIAIDVNNLPKNITLENNKQNFYIPFSGAVRVDFKSKQLPYNIIIKGVTPGSIFELNKELFVIGNNGNVSVEGEGKVEIKIENKSCFLDINKNIKEYSCL